jgi:hypothetical protein
MVLLILLLLINIMEENQCFARAFQGTNDAALREFLEDLDLDKNQIDEIFKQIKNQKEILLIQMQIKEYHLILMLE